MNRIDKVYSALENLDKGKGVITTDIADYLGVSRTNVSNSLNTLHKKGMIFKTGTKPIYYHISEKGSSNLISDDDEPSFVYPKKKKSTLDEFVKLNPSLSTACQQAKAIVLYPPDGMNVLILGETGVGKSMFANYIYNYRKEIKKQNDMPFVVFNCADYASNPQLLLGQLFGVKKGAFTGANESKAGLIEVADGGILFLDEVHRLPPEGQEMFFTFMDNGTYRRLGETDVVRTSKVLIISATTENPESSLLKTFKRRIPMIITLPNLEERTIEERISLISLFIYNEAKKLDKTIRVSVNALRALSCYKCTNNIGQLKSDIQIICASAYADYMTMRKSEIIIDSFKLPKRIQDGLMKNQVHREVWTKFTSPNNRYIDFNSTSQNTLIEKDFSVSIYQTINEITDRLKNTGVSQDELASEIDKEINNYFHGYLNKINSNMLDKDLINMVGDEIYNISKEMIQFAEEKLNKKFSRDIIYSIILHVNNTITGLKTGVNIINDNINQIRLQHRAEFNVALSCVQFLEENLKLIIPIDESAYLTLFFAYNEHSPKNQNVKIFVIAHGNNTATSIADVANSLLNTDIVTGIDAPLDKSPEYVFSSLLNYINEKSISSEILLLVDMGSLMMISQQLEESISIKTKTIPLVSTLHVLEAASKSILGYNLDDIYQSVEKIYDYKISAPQPQIENTKMAILLISVTGEYGNKTITEYLQEMLFFDKKYLEIISVNINNRSINPNLLKEYQDKYQVLAIVTGGSRQVDEIPQISLEAIFNGEGISILQEIINKEFTYFNIYKTLKNKFDNLNGKELIVDIKNFINNIEKEMFISIESNSLIGITLHIVSVISRIKDGTPSPVFDLPVKNNRKHLEFFSFVKEYLKPIQVLENVIFNDDDVHFIVNNILNASY